MNWKAALILAVKFAAVFGLISWILLILCLIFPGSADTTFEMDWR